MSILSLRAPVKAMVLCLVVVSLSFGCQEVASAQTSLIAPDDPHLVYVGRWNFDNPKRPWCAWQGCSVTIRFEGVALGVRLNPADGSHYYGVLRDNRIETYEKFQAEEGPQAYPLVTGLSAGTHQVELIRESYANSNWEFLGFVLRSGAILPPESRPARKIEFYGDSNLAGTSNESERDRGSGSLKTSTFVFAGIAARMLDAEYHNISWGGETISGINRYLSRMEHDVDSALWDHSLFPADLVVANIGANDIYFRTKEAIKEDYHELLDDLRTIHPTAHIMLFNAFGWDKREPAAYTDEVIAERGDPNMSSAVFPWVFEQFHGCQYDQGGMAQYLADHVTEVLGWEQAPIDTLNGYGINGDVANGSFEGVAPFGGWAWRYFDDAGVARIENPDEAHDGDYFLLLQDGAESHQPNPTWDGQEVSVTVWMRAASEGARARLTIDFRNQQIYSDPMASQNEFFELTSEWQPYSSSATAPADAPDPVFNSRITVKAGPGDSVMVDSVSMTIE